MPTSADRLLSLRVLLAEKQTLFAASLTPDSKLHRAFSTVRNIAIRTLPTPDRKSRQRLPNHNCRHGPAGDRTEEIDLLKLLSQLFTERARQHTIHAGAIIDSQTGLEFRPGFVVLQPNNDLSVRTCSTIEIRHPAKIPIPIFEYQHSTGETAEISFRNGFKDWSELDLPVLLDAMEDSLKTCTALEMEFPDHPARRVVLGPVTLWGPPATTSANSAQQSGDEHPPFCPCCLFVNAIKAFHPLLTSPGLFAIRIFANRRDDGELLADCRVNCEDYPPGLPELISYARKWPNRGFEARKQYIIIQDRPNSQPVPPTL